MRRGLLLQVLLWACALFFFLPKVLAQEDTKVVTGKYTVGTTETPFTGKPSLEKALEGATLAQITAIEVTAGDFESADWRYLQSHAADFASLAKLTIGKGLKSVANIETLNELPALKEVYVAKVEHLDQNAFTTTIESISLPDCTDLGSSATKDYTHLKVLNVPNLNSFGNFQFENCGSSLEQVVLGERDVAIDPRYEGEDWRDNVFTTNHPKLSFTAKDGSELTKEKYEAMVKLYQEVNDGNDKDMFWYGFAIEPYTPNTKYPLTLLVEPTDAGKITTLPEGTAFKENTKITLTVENNHGYMFKGLEVFKTDTPTEKITLTDNAFAMPTAAVTAKATFVANSLSVKFTGASINETYTGVDMPSVLTKVSVDKTKVEEIEFLAGTFDATDYKALSDLYTTADGFTNVKKLSVAKEVAVYAMAKPGEKVVLPTKLEELVLANMPRIEAKVFEGAATLKTVRLPQTVSVGQLAFHNCTRLATLDAPALTTIGRNAFEGCTALNNLSLPALEKIEMEAFKGCTTLAKLTLCGEKAPMLTASDVFSGCPEVRSLAFVNSHNAAYTKKELYQVVERYDQADQVFNDKKWYGWALPESGVYKVTYERNDFGKVEGETLAEPNELVKVKVTPSAGYELTKLVYTDGATDVPITGLTFQMPAKDVTVKATFNAIKLVLSVNGTQTGKGDGLLDALKNAGFDPQEVAKLEEITELTLVSGAFTMPQWEDLKNLMPKCKNLTAITIKKEVGLEAMPTVEPVFAAPKCTTVTIEAKLDIMADKAFSGAKELTTVRLLATKELKDGVFGDCKKLTTVEMPLLQQLGSGVFLNCTALATVQLPASLKTIPKATFMGCSALTSIPNATTIEEVEDSAFEGCIALTQLVCPNLKEVGANAFKGCTGVTKLELGLHFGNAGENAFDGCEKVEHMRFVNLSSADTKAFANMKALRTAELPKLTTVSSNLFAGCSALTSLTLQECESIEENGLSKLDALETLAAPKLSTLGKEALSFDFALKNLTVPALSTIGVKALYRCEALTSAYLPALSEIAEQGMAECKELLEVYAPMLASIGKSAFKDCKKFAKITLGEEVPSVENKPFAGCAATRNLQIVLSSGSFEDAIDAYKADTDNFKSGKWAGWTLPSAASLVLSFTVKMEGEEEGVLGAMVTLMDATGNTLAVLPTDSEGQVSFVVPVGSYKYNVTKTHCNSVMNQACEVKSGEDNKMEVKLTYITYPVVYKTEPETAKDHVEWTVKDTNNADVASGSQVVEGTMLTLSVVAKEHYKIKSLVVDGKTDLLPTTEAMYEVREAVTFVAKVAQILSAKYKKQQVNGILVVKYKETEAELGENEEVEEGTELLFELKPNVGYSVEKLFANGVEIATDAPYTVTENVEFTATFAVKTTQYTVAYTKTPEHGTVQVKNGSVAVEPNTTVAANTMLMLEFAPAANYKVKSVVAKVKDKADETLTVTDNKAAYTVTADVTFEVIFEAEGAPQPTYTVVYTKTPEHGTVQVKNGSVAVEPNTTVAANTVLTLEFAPAANYKVKSVVAKVKDKADETLTVTDNKATYTVIADVTFEVVFEAEGAPQPSGFTVTYVQSQTLGKMSVKNGTELIATGATVPANTMLTIELTPAANCKVKQLVAKVKDKADEVLTVTDNKATYTVTTNVTFEAAFEKVTALTDARLLNVAVMPNPFAAQFRIVGIVPEEVGVHYALLNALGVVVRAGVCTTETVVETSDLRAGVYFLRLVMADGATKVLKLVKE
jgi:surface antigen bspA-like